MIGELIYRRYSEYLADRFGEKVYKLPISLPVSCPNRDGYIGEGACSFCGEEGGSFENLSKSFSVKEQLKKNMAYIGGKYKANKFIAYFQNFSNTYLPLEDFKACIREAIGENIVGISISTRPDCISDMYLEFLQGIKEDFNLEITIELGLQTVNYHSLEKINRGHGLAEFIDAALRCKKYSIRVCAHLILNLPWDNDLDGRENARIISALGIEEVKLHALYIIKGTKLGKEYMENKIQIISKEEYIERVISFLEYLNPDIIIQRLIGRAPEDNTIFVNWNESWWKIRDEIEGKMIERNTYQGRKFNYLNGKALKRFG